MPTYEYFCPKCKKKFTVILSIRDHDAGKAKCPKCGGKKLEQRITSFQNERQKIIENDHFKQQFGTLLRSVQSLSDSLKLYNEGLIAERAAVGN